MNTIGVKVQYFGLVRNTVGLEEEQITVPEGSCVEDALNVLCERHGEQFRSVILRSNGTLRTLAVVTLNDKNIRDVDGLKTRLESNAELSLSIGVLPIIGG